MRDNQAGDGLPSGDGGSGGGFLTQADFSLQGRYVTFNHAGAGGTVLSSVMAVMAVMAGESRISDRFLSIQPPLVEITQEPVEMEDKPLTYVVTHGGDGGDGGGIYNVGTLIAENASIDWNQTGAAGVGEVGYGNSGGFVNGVPGKGGGVYNTAYIKLTESQIIGNVTAPAIKIVTMYSVEVILLDMVGVFTMRSRQRLH